MNLPYLIYMVFLPLLGIAAWASFLRLLRGPSLPDRVVAIDFLALTMIGGAALYAIATGEKAFLSVAVVLALISFIGTVAFAFYLRWEERK